MHTLNLDELQLIVQEQDELIRAQIEAVNHLKTENDSLKSELAQALEEITRLQSRIQNRAA